MGARLHPPRPTGELPAHHRPPDRGGHVAIWIIFMAVLAAALVVTFLAIRARPPGSGAGRRRSGP